MGKRHGRGAQTEEDGEVFDGQWVLPHPRETFLEGHEHEKCGWKVMRNVPGAGPNTLATKGLK